MAAEKFESPLPHYKTLYQQGFYLLNNNCDKSAPMEGVKYKGLKLVKGERWYVEYFFKIPDELKHEHNNRIWKRFRVYAEIDRREGEEKERFAQRVLVGVRIKLSEDGYNPFNKEDKYLVKKSGKSLTISQALDYFKENIKQKGVEPATATRYISTADLLEDYLLKIGKQNAAPDQIDESIIAECLQFYKTNLRWGNRQYNNKLGYLSIIFNYLIKRKKIDHNPCIHISKLKSISHKHRYYDDQTLKLVLDTMHEKDPYLRLAALFVYYAGVRSAKELVGLQVKDILMDRDRIRFKGSETKGKREEYIFLDPLLKAAIVDSGIMEFPAEYYIFNHTGQPREKQASDEYLQKHFRKIRRLLKLGQDYTLYGFKHTRCVHLLLDGAQPVDIMQLMRHRDLQATTKYIRDLGFDLNVKFADKSRKL